MLEERIAEIFEQCGIAEIVRMSKNDELANCLQLAMIEIAKDDPVKEFEKRVIDAVSELRNLIGAKRVNVEIHVDNYEKGCKTDVMFFTSTPTDASRVPGGACKAD